MLQRLHRHALQEGLVLHGSAPVRGARPHECTPVDFRGAMESGRQVRDRGHSRVLAEEPPGHAQVLDGLRSRAETTS